ncbi:F-box protein At3g07870-like [Salvia hispanica]|uniref:F-box protein At3g07870-like n=1 Tax=Salvia hispanica TaxID=49212 RepID=UPI0020091F67|nr:F-box protein At3g07870-like [Salvia hispanica]
MEQNIFKNLPSDLTTNILSRLPLRTISISKCVCKPWLNLLQSHDFAKSKLKTPPALAQLTPLTSSTQCTVFQFQDEDEADVESHALRFRPIADFEIHLGNKIKRCRAQETNGLLLIHTSSVRRVSVSNPITREYINLFIPAEYVSAAYSLSFGFGVSKISEQYKIVCINADNGSDSHCVYTLGTGTWRRVEAGAASGFKFCFHAYIECNGNLHWTLEDSAEILSICAFDLDTECFSIFSAPVIEGLTEDRHAIDFRFNVLRGCLCLSYTLDDKVVIWMMKEYRVKESWTMVYHIGIDIDCGIDDCHWKLMNVYPIKLFENGDVLMFLEEKCIIYYSNKTGTLQHVCRLTEGTSEDDEASAMIFTPTPFSLKSFGVENVISF